uniref:BHLH domain-containing protein n=1 Tax=Rhabditophanes sp. KR3021 TaxID=114890 RepID=A0AC35TSM3_9BILA
MHSNTSPLKYNEANYVEQSTYIPVKAEYVPAKRGRKRKGTSVSGESIPNPKQTEKMRNSLINTAFDELQNIVPFIPRQQKLPKIKILKLANKYIEHLKKVLNMEPATTEPYYDSPRPLGMDDFYSTALEVLQQKNSYINRASEELSTQVEDRKSVDSETSNGTTSSNHSLLENQTPFILSKDNMYEPIPTQEYFSYLPQHTTLDTEYSF